MISALQWVRRGAAQARPDKYDLDEKEFKRINEFAAQHLADAKEELAAAQRAENEYVFFATCHAGTINTSKGILAESKSRTH